MIHLQRMKTQPAALPIPKLAAKHLQSVGSLSVAPSVPFRFMTFRFEALLFEVFLNEAFRCVPLGHAPQSSAAVRFDVAHRLH